MDGAGAAQGSGGEGGGGQVRPQVFSIFSKVYSVAEWYWKHGLNPDGRAAVHNNKRKHAAEARSISNYVRA